MPAWTSLHRSTPRGLPLWLEIALVLLIKVVALFFLWKTFFSHPQTKHMALPTPAVEQHLLTAPQSLSRSPVLPERS